MKVLILGGQGMLGHKLFEVLQPRHDVYATFRSARGPWRRFPMYEMYKNDERTLGNVDALRLDTVVDAIARVQPDVVINCIGVIKQLDDEVGKGTLIAVNALFPHHLYQVCRAAGARLLQISTDCVFSGARGNYSEDDQPDPVDAYGRTKVLGEIDRPGALTIRTSLIGRDFVKDVGLLEWFLSNRGGAVNGYARAIFSGFTTRAFSEIVGQLIADHPQLSGIYHVASEPISKLALLQAFRDRADLDIEIMPDEHFHCDRSLNADRFLEETSCSLPTWEEMIDALCHEVPIYDQWRATYGLSGQ